MKTVQEEIEMAMTEDYLWHGRTVHDKEGFKLKSREAAYREARRETVKLFRRKKRKFGDNHSWFMAARSSDLLILLKSMKSRCVVVCVPKFYLS